MSSHAVSENTELAQRTVRKVMLRLVPFAGLLYLLAYLDRVNIGFAALTMNADLQLSATAYGAAAGIFSLGYIIFEIPSNIMLERVGARLWITRIMISWGMVSAAMALAQGPYSLSALRFVLGVAEAGLLPGIIFYFSQWIPTKQRARIMSGFFIALPLAFIIGAPISTAILSLDWLGLRGWQWMFILEGVASSIVGIAVFFFLTDRPKDAKWLTDEERNWLIATLDAEYAARGGAKVAELRHGLTNPHVLLLGVMYAGALAASGSFGFWLPLIIKGLGGLSNIQVGLLTTVPYIVAIFAIMPWSRHAEATGELKWHVCLPMLLAAIGFAFSAWVSDPRYMVVLIGLTIVLIYVVPPVFWTMATRTLNGPAAAAGIALINCIASFGSYIGPQLMGYLKDATDSYRPGLLLLSAFLLLATALGLWLNRKSAIPSSGH
ncbi:MAG: MFS transporter [Rhodospirillaceae bacterium]|nr:MFS transporter [Rhodospirillaceae bacterium]